MNSKYYKIRFWEFRNKIYSFLLKYFIPYNELIEAVINELNPLPGFYTLDAGCGPGLFERRLMEKKILNLKIDAIDISNKIIETAKQNNRSFNNINFKIMDLNDNLKYQDQIFDSIVCINVFYLLTQPQKTLLEFYRVLKKDGRIVITAPKSNFNYWTLLKSHFLKSKGFKKIRDMIIFPFILGLIFPFEFIIGRKERKGEYHRFEKSNIIKLFQTTQFQNLKIRNTYAGQNFLITARK